MSGPFKATTTDHARPDRGTTKEEGRDHEWNVQDPVSVMLQRHPVGPQVVVEILRKLVNLLRFKVFHERVNSFEGSDRILIDMLT